MQVVSMACACRVLACRQTIIILAINTRDTCKALRAAKVREEVKKPVFQNVWKLLHSGVILLEARCAPRWPQAT